eukprot:scaffold1211_cov195-Alexandrium_tamarense.AAC.32
MSWRKPLKNAKTHAALNSTSLQLNYKTCNTDTQQEQLVATLPLAYSLFQKMQYSRTQCRYNMWWHLRRVEHWHSIEECLGRRVTQASEVDITLGTNEIIQKMTTTHLDSPSWRKHEREYFQKDRCSFCMKKLKRPWPNELKDSPTH